MVPATLVVTLAVAVRWSDSVGVLVGVGWQSEGGDGENRSQGKDNKAHGWRRELWSMLGYWMC